MLDPKEMRRSLARDIFGAWLKIAGVAAITIASVVFCVLDMHEAVPVWMRMILTAIFALSLPTAYFLSKKSLPWEQLPLTRFGQDYAKVARISPTCWC